MLSALFFLVVIAIFVIALDVFIMTGMHRLSQQKGDRSGPRFLLNAFLPQNFQREWKNTFVKDMRFRYRLGILLELTLLAAWVIMLGSEYLDMSPLVIPGGNEFGSTIQSHHLWKQFQTCGLCALWNGSQSGGFPSFADIQGSMLHPLVIITTLLFGVINGVKISLLIALWCAGFAQWWIARELRLSWLPRMWSAAVAIAGGHLSGRMELGVFGIVLATAMGSLVFAGILHLENSKTRRAAIILGIAGALAVLAGQGYMQVGLIGILPAAVVFLFEKGRKIAPHWEYYALAVLIAFLLAAPLLIPLAHFAPNISKYMDPEFEAAQPLNFFVLNLVINDPDYFRTEVLGKFPYPYLYSLFIGWVPILLAAFGLAKAKRDTWKLFFFLTAGSILALLIASAVVLKPLTNIIPSIAGIRHSPQIAGLAIPLILALSAYGLEQLINLRWPNLFISYSTSDAKPLSTRWIILIPLFICLKNTYDFSKLWFYTVEGDVALHEILSTLKTDSLQWVEPPYGQHTYIEPAIEMGLKLSPGILTWDWRDRESPMAIKYITDGSVPPGSTELIGEVNGLSIFEDKQNEYAFVEANGNIYPCKAKGAGGFISVHCNIPEPGNLIIKEYTWTGWHAWVDNNFTQLEPDKEWLKTKALAGNHTYTFKYLPWDVPVGIFLFICGFITCMVLWRQSNNSDNQKVYTPNSLNPF